MAIKGIGHPKIKILSLFTHPHVMLYGFKTIYGPQKLFGYQGKFGTT